MPKRLVIPVEFSSIKDEDIKLYLKLKSFDRPASIIKDILKGRLPISVLLDEEESKC